MALMEIVGRLTESVLSFSLLTPQRNNLLLCFNFLAIGPKLVSIGSKVTKMMS